MNLIPTCIHISLGFINAICYYISVLLYYCTVGKNKYNIFLQLFKNMLQDYFGFIKAINVAVRGKGPNYECHTSEVTQGLLKLISTLDEFITNTPPINQPQRFGNQAFKAWYEKVKQV